MPISGRLSQPPSGGCELKLAALLLPVYQAIQPPSGGCELKRRDVRWRYLLKPSRLRAAVS